jgi:hypothetical protein
MYVIKGILYFISALFVLSGLLLFVPWGALNALMVTFQAPEYPDVAVVQYTVKVFFLITFWIGALLALAVRQRFFYWDAVSSAVIGLLVLLYRQQALRAAGRR